MVGEPSRTRYALRGTRTRLARFGGAISGRGLRLCPAPLEVGTLDDPSVFGTPQMAILTAEKQIFHQLPPGVPAFERGPR